MKLRKLLTKRLINSARRGLGNALIIIACSNIVGLYVGYSLAKNDVADYINRPSLSLQSTILPEFHTCIQEVDTLREVTIAMGRGE